MLTLRPSDFVRVDSILVRKLSAFRNSGRQTATKKDERHHGAKGNQNEPRQPSHINNLGLRETLDAAKESPVALLPT